MSEESTSSTTPTKRKRGRPRKAEVAAKRKPGKVGRPKGDSAIMADYKSRMLASPKSKAIVQKVMDLALSDDHPDAQACRKLVFDRVLPASYFEKDKMSGGKPQIDININLGDTGASATVSDEAVEGEYTEVE